MKAAELMNYCLEIMKTLSKVGIRMDDCEHMELWRDYQNMLQEGHKKTYILAVLSRRHHISERTAMRVIKRFDRDV